VRNILAQGLPLPASAAPGAAPERKREVLLDRIHVRSVRGGSDTARVPTRPRPSTPGPTRGRTLRVPPMRPPIHLESADIFSLPTPAAECGRSDRCLQPVRTTRVFMDLPNLIRRTYHRPRSPSCRPMLCARKRRPAKAASRRRSRGSVRPWRPRARVSTTSSTASAGGHFSSPWICLSNRSARLASIRRRASMSDRASFLSPACQWTIALVSAIQATSAPRRRLRSSQSAAER